MGASCLVSILNVVLFPAPLRPSQPKHCKTSLKWMLMIWMVVICTADVGSQWKEILEPLRLNNTHCCTLQRNKSLGDLCKCDLLHQRSSRPHSADQHRDWDSRIDTFYLSIPKKPELQWKKNEFTRLSLMTYGFIFKVLCKQRWDVFPQSLAISRARHRPQKPLHVYDITHNNWIINSRSWKHFIWLLEKGYCIFCFQSGLLLA